MCIFFGEKAENETTEIPIFWAYIRCTCCGWETVCSECAVLLLSKGEYSTTKILSFSVCMINDVYEGEKVERDVI